MHSRRAQPEWLPGAQPSSMQQHRAGSGIVTTPFGEGMLRRCKHRCCTFEPACAEASTLARVSHGAGSTDGQISAFMSSETLSR